MWVAFETEAVLSWLSGRNGPPRVLCCIALCGWALTGLRMSDLAHVICERVNKLEHIFLMSLCCFLFPPLFPFSFSPSLIPLCVYFFVFALRRHGGVRPECQADVELERCRAGGV